MATAPTSSSSSSPPASSPGGRVGLAGYLRTREGKIVAGGMAALAVVLLALRRAAGATGTAVGQDPAQMVAPGDGTLQGALDQVGGGGGTLSEWISATGDLTSEVAQLRDLLQDPMQQPNPSTPKPPGSGTGKAPRSGWLPGHSLRRVGRVGTPVSLRDTAARFAPSQHPDAIESTLRRIVALNPALKGKRTIPGGFALKVPKFGPLK